MNYEQEKDDKVYYYYVTYDVNKLREILEELKKYNYVYVSEGKLNTSYVTNFPITDGIIKSRTIAVFNKDKRDYFNGTLDPDSIKRHKERKEDYITFNFLLDKMPDLYTYIDFILNGGDYRWKYIFGANRKWSFYQYLWHRDQILIEEILNYENSHELANNPHNTNKDYDYKGLNELYKKALECFKFNLVAIKEKINSEEEISGVLMLKKENKEK